MRRFGTLLAVVGAVVLVGSLFFDWYREAVSHRFAPL